MEDNHVNFAIRSEEVQDVLSKPPKWITRWGMTMIFFLICILLSVSFVIKYPDVLSGNVTVSTVSPPVKLVSLSNGYLKKFSLKTGDYVNKGDLIAEINTTTSQETINKLSKALASFRLNDCESFLLKYENIGALGELQSGFNSLTSSIKAYNNVSNNLDFDLIDKKIDKQIQLNKQLVVVANDQLKLMENELRNAQERVSIDSSLYKKGLISNDALLKSREAFTTVKQKENALKKSFFNSHITINSFEIKKSESHKNEQTRILQLETEIMSKLKSLKIRVDEWKKRFSFIAPISGEISVLGAVYNNQFINSGENLFAIVPESNKLLGHLILPPNGFGKIKLGQKVRIKLNNYPSNEFGFLTGEVSHISTMTSKEGYFLEVILPKKLTSSYGIELDYFPEMTGVAEIITEDYSLIERVFFQLKKIMNYE